MSRIEFEPEMLAFFIHKPMGISGCEVEEVRVDLDRETVIIHKCEDGEPVTEEVSLHSDYARDLLRGLAADVGDIEAALLAIMAGAPVEEFFVDMRYVINFDSTGKPVLEAVEILPCHGDPKCRWERIERGLNKLYDAFLDTIEEQLNIQLA